MKNKLIGLLSVGIISLGICTVRAENWIFTAEGNNSNNVQVTDNTHNIIKKEDDSKMVSLQILNRYEVLNKEFLDVPDTLESIALTQMHSSQNDGISGSADVPISDLGRVELPWYNGNYLVWNTDTGYGGLYFAAEYDKDKEKQGLVILFEENNGVIHCSEYLDNGEWDVPLVTNFVYYKKDKAAFLYDNNKNLIMYQLSGYKRINNQDIITDSDFIDKIIPKLNNPKKYIIPYKD